MVRFKAKNKKGNPLGVSGPPSVGRLWKTQEEFRFSALPGNLETIEEIPSSGQDGGVGRNPLPPRTTKRRVTTNLKSVNNQKCQEIKLHGTSTTKELKKKSTRTTRLVRTCGKAADCMGGAG